MQYDTTINGEDVTLEVEYTMGQVDRGDHIGWGVIDFNITEIDGVAYDKSSPEIIAVTAAISEDDLIFTIMEWEN